jgi:hypothetical protein
MGWWNWWTRATPRQTTDTVWLSAAAKWDGVAADVERGLLGDERVLVVAFYQDTLTAAATSLQKSQVDYALWNPSHEPLPWQQPSDRRVRLTLAEFLEADSSQTPEADRTAMPLLVLVVEHHPLARHDDAVTQAAARISSLARVKYHCSLDDPLLQRFVGPQIRTVLETLGMQPNESIDSRMVGRRIRAAQTRIERMATGDTPAGSAAEWLQRNCPA